MSNPSKSSLDPAWLDKMYNNRALVPEHTAIFARWRAASALARQQERCFLDVAYGRGPNETLDVFVSPHAKAGHKAPIVVFIHGGYWRSLDKADHSFVASAFTREGAHVVIPNYALCPAVTIPDITMQMVKALAWVWRNMARMGGDPTRLVVAGHSAGGHLAAMLLSCDWPRYGHDLPADLVTHAVSLSGLYELESVRRTPFLSDLRLNEADAVRASPAWMPAPVNGKLYSFVGGDESAEFLRHNQLIEHAWGAEHVPVCEVLPGVNHFTVLDALVRSDTRLHKLVSQFLI